MPCGNNHVVSELLAGASAERTIDRKLSETRGMKGRVTTGVQRFGKGVAGKVIAAVVALAGTWIANSLVQKWLTSRTVSNTHSKIIQDSYEPMIRDVLRTLHPALTTAVQRISQGQVVDAQRIVAKDRAKIARIIDKHFVEMVRKLRVAVHQDIMEDVQLKLEEALANQVPQALSTSEYSGDSQMPVMHIQ